MASNGFNLTEFLNGLEKEAEKVDTPETVIETPVAQATSPVDEDMAKIAALQEEGQIMARAFYNELQKLAVGDGPITEDTSSIAKPSDVNHVSTGVLLPQAAGTVAAVLKAKAAPTVQTAGGVIEDNTAQAMPTERPVDPKPLPADAMKAQERQEAMNKAAANQILSNLYGKFFGGNE